MLGMSDQTWHTKHRQTPCRGLPQPAACGAGVRASRPSIASQSTCRSRFWLPALARCGRYNAPLYRPSRQRSGSLTSVWIIWQPRASSGTTSGGCRPLLQQSRTGRCGAAAAHCWHQWGAASPSPIYGPLFCVRRAATWPTTWLAVDDVSGWRRKPVPSPRRGGGCGCSRSRRTRTGESANHISQPNPLPFPPSPPSWTPKNGWNACPPPHPLCLEGCADSAALAQAREVSALWSQPSS